MCTVKKCLLILAIIMAGAMLTACSDSNNNRVLIFSSAEYFRNDHILQRLQEEFPDYDITVQYMPTGHNAARIMAEGTDTEADIVLALDLRYLNSLTDYFADLSHFDFSIYLDELIPDVKKIMVWERWSGAVIIDTNALYARGLPVPTSYQDLLDPMYRGLIAMPNPRSSGTGYFFLYKLVHAWGEDEAFAFFDALAPNIMQFTTSGSGPIRSLLQGEIAIGLGMTFQAVTEKNNGADFKITWFEEGAPYGASGFAMIRGREEIPAVRAVFDFLASTLIWEDKELFSPEIIFVGQTINVENYPDVPYADMYGFFDEATRIRLLDRWVH